MKAGHDNLLQVGNILTIIFGLIKAAGGMGEVCFLGSVGTRYMCLISARAAMCVWQPQMPQGTDDGENPWIWVDAAHKGWCKGLVQFAGNRIHKICPFEGDRWWELLRRAMSSSWTRGKTWCGQNTCTRLISTFRPTWFWPSCHPFEVKVRNARSKQSRIGCRSWHALFVPAPYLCHCRGRVWDSPLD